MHLAVGNLCSLTGLFESPLERVFIHANIPLREQILVRRSTFHGRQECCSYRTIHRYQAGLPVLTLDYQQTVWSYLGRVAFDRTERRLVAEVNVIAFQS